MMDLFLDFGGEGAWPGCPLDPSVGDPPVPSQ